MERAYETLVAISPDLNKIDIGKAITKIKNEITKQGGSILHFEDIGIVNFFYPVKQKDKGYFFCIRFNIDPSKISNIEYFYRINKDIYIRSIVTKLDKYAIDYNEKYIKSGGTICKNISYSKVNKKEGSNVLSYTKMYCRFKRYGIRYVDYKNTTFLRGFVNKQGKILPRRLTGNSLKYQKKVALSTKRSRSMGTLPFVVDNL